MQSLNEPGTLAQIAQVIAEHDGNIDNIRMARRAPDFTDLLIDLEVYDLKHLNGIIAQLRAKQVVAQGRAGERVSRRLRRRRPTAESINSLDIKTMPDLPPLRLGVNIDHVATVRNARGGVASRSGRGGATRRSRPARTASRRTCARIAATSATTTSRG